MWFGTDFKAYLAAFSSVIFWLGLAFTASGQAAREPSIIFLTNAKEERLNYFPETLDDGFPYNIEEYKLFYIQIEEQDYIEHKWKFADIHKKINGYIERMLNKYPYESEVFERFLINESDDFFMDKNCRYRLFVYAKITAFKLGSEPTEYKEYFGFSIKDLKTGEFYYHQNLDYLMRVTNKFVKHAKKGVPLE
ncbi:MAG: hypothetical protein RIE58_07895 [Vicingaceae bacterium]